ncbi:hypothetical protein CKA32_000476 [Geitlerinema sp. FC II]|nr:DUF4157 domain-containing protein [Geitlerinema sp. CS-897]PPT06366.1 hypothetical protein CKA32_000476 [Geitlerinema sp. FC II]
MSDRTFEAKKQQSRHFELRPQQKRGDRTPKPQETPPLDILARTGSRTQTAATVKTHAKTIRRLQTARSPLARQALLQLQRQYGNRYVRRVVELARQSNDNTEVAPEIEAAIERQRGSGQALDNGVRHQMESAFGVDFRRVHIHTDTESDLLNRSLEARAFTVGSDIFFSQGEYAPGSTSGKELLAHELTHVVQQSSGVRRKLTVSQPGDPEEREADRIATAIARSPQVSLATETDEEEGIEHREVALARSTSNWLQPLSVGVSSGEIMRVTDTDRSGSDWLSLTVPDGPYVVEATNVEADVNSAFEYTRGFQYFNDAYHHSPMFAGIEAIPFRGRSDENRRSRNFQIRARTGSDRGEPDNLWTSGRAWVLVYVKRPGYISDYPQLTATVWLDTVPYIGGVRGSTQLITSKAYDVTPGRYHPFTVRQGEKVTLTEQQQITVSDGYVLSRGRTITDTISATISSEIGADIEVLSSSIGSEISSSNSVANTIGTQYTQQVQASRTITIAREVTNPGNWAVVATAQVYKTPVTVNNFDRTGKKTSQSNADIYTIIYNPIPDILPTNDRGIPQVTSP